jgi:GTPase SAR1 family protein
VTVVAVLLRDAGCVFIPPHRNAVGIVGVYDVTDASSWERVKEMVDAKLELCDPEVLRVVVVVGNKVRKSEYTKPSHQDAETEECIQKPSHPSAKTAKLVKKHFFFCWQVDKLVEWPGEGDAERAVPLVSRASSVPPR